MGINTRMTLLRSGTGAFNATFNVGGMQRMIGVFVDGLATGESVTVQMLKSKAQDGDDSLAVDTNWFDCKIDGVVVQFTSDINVRSFLIPGVYRLKCSAAAGTITAGVYYG